jgi:hypothetical protein
MLSGVNPFKVRNKNKHQKLQMILDCKIKLLPIFSPQASDLLSQLLV